MIAQALTCKELVEIVSDYLEGALPSGERARFEAHLATCHGCNAYLEQMKQTIHALGCLTEDAIPPPHKQELLQIFRDWKQSR